jgi:hypothetical protein
VHASPPIRQDCPRSAATVAYRVSAAKRSRCSQASASTTTPGSSAALYAPLLAEPHPNSARFAFLNPAAHDFYPEWERNTQELVAAMRGEAGRNPYDRKLSDLVGELSTRSERFRTLWAAHNVRYHRSGIKRINHPVVGEMELTYEAFELPADPGLQLSTYTAEPGSASADKLKMLASWAATDAAGPVPAETEAAPERTDV